MRHESTVGVVIPALDEASSIALVLDAIPTWVDKVVVVDNGSVDATASVASEAGAVVVGESSKGYGSACQRGIATLGEVDVVVFLDADFSDYPERMDRLVDPLLNAGVDLTLGARASGAGTAWHQRSGTWLVCTLVAMIWGRRYLDLGPFRAIRRVALEDLQMMDRDYGWTVEMQVKALVDGLTVLEVPVEYRARIGQSKISGTMAGSIKAGLRMLQVIAKLAWGARRVSASRGRTERSASGGSAELEQSADR